MGDDEVMLLTVCVLSAACVFFSSRTPGTLKFDCGSALSLEMEPRKSCESLFPCFVIALAPFMSNGDR